MPRRSKAAKADASALTTGPKKAKHLECPSGKKLKTIKTADGARSFCANVKKKPKKSLASAPMPPMDA